MKSSLYILFPLLGAEVEIGRSPMFDGLYSYEKVMLVCGVIFFLVLMGAFVFIVFIKKQSPLKLLLFFMLSFVMMGFPVVEKVKFDKDGAEIEFQERALRQNPSNLTAQKKLAATVEKVESRPFRNPNVFLRLARANEALGNREKAIAQLNTALQIRPNLPEAVKMRSSLRKLGPIGRPTIEEHRRLSNLAETNAKSGDFNKAIEYQQKAIALAKKQNADEKIITEYEKRLKAYQARKLQWE